MKSRQIAYLIFGIATFVMSASPALAWWQFVAYNPDGERKVYARYASEKTCQAALKKVDARLGKTYPKLFPRVGSCEEYK
jgi:uncharacterized iron-regulated membrane protein